MKFPWPSAGLYTTFKVKFHGTRGQGTRGDMENVSLCSEFV
jgi:hypothetical protein